MNNKQHLQNANRLILLTGATGYVGARLLRALEQRALQVRCPARRPEMLNGRTGARTEIAAGDVLDPDSLDRALQNVDAAFYLVHSMGSAGSFEESDRQAAQNFASAAAKAGISRIVYLGGLGDSQQPLSAHLRSRHEVGELLRSTGVQVIEFRASIVIGSGSLSFEMIRALVERLPVMIAPRWVSVLSQPIAVSDLLSYLAAAIDLEVSESRVFEIGGADQVSYGDLMREYARQRGLRRLIIPVPVLTPRLSSLWLGLVTPLYARVGRKLIDSICYPSHEAEVARGDSMTMRGRTWQLAKPKPPPKPKVADDVRKAVDAQAAILIAALKKRFRKKPKNPRFNWCDDLFTRWHREALYFVKVMRTPHGNPPTFETHVARMEHTGKGKFSFAVPMRRGWNTMRRNATPEECLKEIETSVYF